MTGPPPAPDPHGPGSRSGDTPVGLIARELQGLDRWHAARRTEEHGARGPGLNRDQRRCAARQLNVRQCQHDAILEQLAAQDTPPPRPLGGLAQPTAVIGHRLSWVRERLSRALADRGVVVLATTDHGAEIAGICGVEQPALVILDEPLVMLAGCVVTAELTRFCPATLIVGYVHTASAVPRILHAGASTAFTRRVPPVDVAARLAAVLLR